MWYNMGKLWGISRMGLGKTANVCKQESKVLKINCPYSHKFQLVNWLVRNRGWTKSDATKLTIRQLYAVWYKQGKRNKQ